jgi:hypothetical protein
LCAFFTARTTEMLTDGHRSVNGKQVPFCGE